MNVADTRQLMIAHLFNAGHDAHHAGGTGLFPHIRLAETGNHLYLQRNQDAGQGIEEVAVGFIQAPLQGGVSFWSTQPGGQRGTERGQ